MQIVLFSVQHMPTNAQSQFTYHNQNHVGISVLINFPFIPFGLLSFSCQDISYFSLLGFCRRYFHFKNNLLLAAVLQKVG